MIPNLINPLLNHTKLINYKSISIFFGEGVRVFHTDLWVYNKHFHLQRLILYG